MGIQRLGENDSPVKSVVVPDTRLRPPIPQIRQELPVHQLAAPVTPGMPPLGAVTPGMPPPGTVTPAMPGLQEPATPMMDPAATPIQPTIALPSPRRPNEPRHAEQEAETEVLS